jgi:hypothetical protein
VIGVLLITAPNHPSCEETIAELSGVRLDLVKKCMQCLNDGWWFDRKEIIPYYLFSLRPPENGRLDSNWSV